MNGEGSGVVAAVGVDSDPKLIPKVFWTSVGNSAIIFAVSPSGIAGSPTAAIAVAIPAPTDAITAVIISPSPPPINISLFQKPGLPPVFPLRSPFQGVFYRFYRQSMH